MHVHTVCTGPWVWGYSSLQCLDLTTWQFSCGRQWHAVTTATLKFTLALIARVYSTEEEREYRTPIFKMPNKSRASGMDHILMTYVGARECEYAIVHLTPYRFNTGWLETRLDSFTVHAYIECELDGGSQLRMIDLVHLDGSKVILVQIAMAEGQDCDVLSLFVDDIAVESWLRIRLPCAWFLTRSWYDCGTCTKSKRVLCPS